MNCLWTVHSLVAGEHISASFGPFDTVSGDILSIYDGPSTSSPLLASYTGSYTPAPPVSSSGSSLTFNFVSDAANSAAAGFTISAVAFVPTQTRTRSRTRTRTRTRRTRTRTRTRIPPVLSGVQPAAVAPTATLTLTGSNFGTSAASAGVFINGVACGITAIAAGQILCTVPWILPRNYSVWVVVGAAASGLRSVQVVGEAGSLALVIRTGHQHNCIAVPATGLTYCWGNNGNGQLGIGNTNAIGDQPGEMPPQAAIIGAPYFDIHLGRYHTCVLNTDRLGVRCIGRNTYGQLGNGDFGSPATDIGDALGELPPATVAIAGPATTLNLSGRTTCALLQNATVQCWGDNTYGQLGYVTPTQMERPGPLANFGAAQIVQIANGFDFMCVLSSVGSVYCIGNNAAGIAGLGAVTGNFTSIGDDPTDYPFATLNLGGTVAQLALTAAEAHCCALLTTGAVKCWGRTSFGNSGTGVSVGNIGDAPGEMPPASTILPSSWVVRTLTTRGDFSCALLEVGEMNCWGPGPTGQLGLATGAIAVLATPSPTYIALGMAKVTAFSQGEVNVCALMTDSDIKCWGRTNQGQLGLGSATQNIGDAVGEMPPPSVPLRPFLFSVTPGVVYAPTSTVTLVGANFGSVGANLSVLIGTVPCALTMVTPLHLECTPQYVAAGYFNVTVTRLGGFGTSAPAGPVRVLPSNPIILSMSPASGGVGVNISMSVLGLSTIPATTVEFRLRNGTVCVTGCTGNVTAVDAVGQSLTVTVPALPSFAEYDVVVTTPTGSSALPSAAVFLYCTDACDACAGTASQCTKCRESLGYHFNIEGTQCVNTACPGNQVLTARTGALRCGCNQTAGFFANSAGTSCVQACAAREYLDVAPVNYICRACHVSCLACLDSSASSCTACPSGVILQLQGGVGNQCVGSCSLCGNGLVSAGNSSQCSCPPGTFYDYGKRSCYPCPGNSYNSQYLDPELVSSQSCTRCPAYTEIVGTGSNRTSVSECVCRSAFVPNTAANDGSCVCPAGSFYDSATSTCLNCEQDTFSSSDGIFSSCTPCPGAFRTTAGLLGQTSSTACVCPLTMVGATSGDCTCAPGSYFESATTSCRLCPQNSFSANFNTDPQCTLCSTLGSYRVASAGANDSSACVCPSSMVEDLATGDCTCAPCTLCSTLGSYRVASAGANDSSACVCPSSMVEDLATGDCTCAPGQYFESATTTCRPCPMDSFTASFNTDPQCTLCSTLGSYRVASAGANDSSACVCPPSMVEDPITRACTCSPGYNFERATTYCRACPPDSFSSNYSTNTECTLCSTIGEFRTTSASGQTNSSSCVCPPSMILTASGNCACEAGYYFIPSERSCRICPANTFLGGQNTAGSCTPCSSLGAHLTTNEVQGRSRPSDCVCEAGFYPSLSTGQCLECSGLAGAARCEGASANTATSGRNLTQVELAGINVQYGYWLTTDAEYLPLTKWSARKYRADWFIIVKCPIAAGCPGGTAEELCATGYVGPACGSCSQGYGRLGGECAVCPDNVATSRFLVFLILAIIVFGYYFSLRRFVTDKSSTIEGQEEVVDSMGIKFAINHLQLIGFMGGFAASWPRSMAKVLSIPTASATISAVFANIGVECSGSLSLNAFAALLFTLPLLLALCVAAIYLYAGIRSQNFDRYWDKTFQGTLILLYVAHPGIVQGVLKLMSCYDVGRQSFALIDMSVDCNSQSFRGLRGFAVFYFLVYCVGGLIGMFFLLRQRPTEYQFMTKCYKPKYYFYDIIVSLRQTLFVIVALFASPPLQLYFGTWILVLSWVSQHILRPYRHTLPSNLDSLSLFVLLLTTTTGSLFFNEVLSPTQGGGVAVAVILIILNLGTVALFLFFAAGTAKDTDSFKKVRKVLSRSLSRAEIKANAIHDSQFPAIELKPI
eukprot:TRINITY_DN4_c0_g1_i8.p1 TRINITY_DN4_c0_g1~~TRINITY_DN4_c0_g1_i8.p1  ORF type:complete len:1943 (-),score=320.33 TRINITY_DN4_c0_g1_i8:129-5819(-)